MDQDLEEFIYSCRFLVLDTLALTLAHFQPQALLGGKFFETYSVFSVFSGLEFGGSGSFSNCTFSI